MSWEYEGELEPSGVDVDFGKTAGDYGRYRAGFPDALFERLAAFGVGRSGQRLLDLGTGTGALARGFAQRGCRVTGLDPSLPLMAQARQLDAQAGLSARYVAGRAEAAGLAAGSFDVVAAGQCWHWFERASAAAEARRLLVGRGWLVIAHFDWLPLPGNVVSATEDLIMRFNPAWKMAGGTGIYPHWFADVAAAGFRDVESFTFDLGVPYTHEAWRGRIRASAGVAASLPPAQVAAFDQALAALLASSFPSDPLDVAHRTFALVCRAP